MAAKEMTERELIALIGEYEKTALGSSTAVGPNVSSNIKPASTSMTTLEVDRFNALNAYFGRPLGNEVDNRSQIVIPELRDTIEWIMPQLMRMFAAGKVCQFDPEGPQDEQQAEIETEVVNHVFLKMNQGFFVLHDMFKDALLLRNGYADAYWEKQRQSKIESYTGLTQIEMTQLFQTDDDLEVLEQTEQQTLLGPTFDIKLRRTSLAGQICVECAPPEEMLISPLARRELDESPFVEHKTQKSRSDLKELGFDKDKVDSIEIARPTWNNLIALARDEVSDQLSEETPSDQASQQVDVRTVFVVVDFDGDGISELRRVVLGGDQILDNYECEEISFAYCSPIRMPHRHVGISFYDLLYDLQVIKTTLFRQGLDNLYLENNRSVAVDINKVNVDDLLISRPGGIRRVNGAPAEAIMEMGGNGTVMQQILPALEYCDSQREMRTGIGKDTMGVDADALQDVTKGGQLAAMSAAAMKVELVARLLAEGVKDLFGKIHRLLIRHQNKSLTLKIAGKWVDVNPSQWKERTNITVNVGLGSGNRDEQRQNVLLMMGLQEKLATTVSSPFYRYAYQSFKQAAHLMGIENPEMYAPTPDDPQVLHMQQNPQPPPELQKAKMEADGRAAQLQQNGQIELQKIQMQGQIQAQNDQRRDQEIRMEAQAEQAKQAQEAALEKQRAVFDAQLEIQKAHFNEWKARLDAETKLLVAQISASKGADTDTGAGDTNQALAAALGGIQEALAALRNPRTATLSDGRRITIQ